MKNVFNFNKLASTVLTNLRPVVQGFTNQMEEMINKSANKTLNSVRDNVKDLDVASLAHLVTNLIENTLFPQTNLFNQKSGFITTKVFSATTTELKTKPVNYALEYIKSKTLSVIDFVQEEHLIEDLTSLGADLINDNLQSACNYFAEETKEITFEQKYSMWLSEIGPASDQEKKLITEFIYALDNPQHSTDVVDHSDDTVAVTKLLKGFNNNSSALSIGVEPASMKNMLSLALNYEEYDVKMVGHTLEVEFTAEVA